MADLDTSALKAVLPGIADSSVKSPFEYANQQAQAQKNALDVQKLQAEKAAGQAYQGAVNPQTGEFDANEFRRRLAASGPAAMAAGAALLNTQSISSDQLKQNLEKAKWVNSASGAALQSGDFSDAAMLRLFQSGIANGTLTMAEVQKHMQTIPADAAGRKQWLTEHQMTGASVQQQLEQRQGTQQTVSTPGATYTVNVPPISANQTVVVPHGPAPGDMVEVKDWVDAKGNVVPSGTAGASERTRLVSKSQVPGAPQGGPPQLVPGTGGGTGTGTGTGTGPPIPPPPGTVLQGGYEGRPGAPAPASPAPAAPATPAPAAPAAVPFGGYSIGGPAGAPVTPPVTPPTVTPPVTSPVTTPAPGGLVVSTAPPTGTREAQDLVAKQWVADQADAGNFQARIWPLVQAHSILKNNPDITTGVGAQAVSTIKSGLQTLTSIFTPADLQSIRQANFEELGKYMQQAVNANPFSASSDAKLAAAVSGNPSLHLSTLTNKDIFKAMIALERTKQAAVNDFQNSGKTAAEWGNFKSTWQTEHDPRAFATDMMDDAPLRDMFTKMSPSERTAYQKTLDLIKANPSIMNTSAMPHAAATPTAAPANALAMAPQQSGNPLLAA